MVIFFYPEMCWRSNPICGDYCDHNANIMFLIPFFYRLIIGLSLVMRRV